MWEEFKKFVARGNVVDMAVGVIMGAAFGAIVKSLVDNVIMPPIGLLTGGVDFADKYVVLKSPPGNFATVDDLVKGGGVVIRYGLFINTVLAFLIVSGVVFLLVRVINKLHKPADAPKTKDCPQCAMAIPVAALRCGHCTSTV